MLSNAQFVRLSLELNLFFGRIAKEHSIFIKTSLMDKNSDLAAMADNFKLHYEGLLAEAISLSNGVISPSVVASGELVTAYTHNAELVSQFYTGVSINSALTQSEAGISGSAGFIPSPALMQRVFALNQRAITLTTALAQFKTRILNDVLACRLFTTNYPLLLDHILREAHFYLNLLSRIQNRQEIDTPEDLLEQERFWNRIMAEHSKFILGLLDPTEEQLINTAGMYGREFDELTRQAIAATVQTLPQVTARSLQAAGGLRDFKTTGTKGLIDCKIKAIAYPLLGDHVLREANHFIRILSRRD